MSPREPYQYPASGPLFPGLNWPEKIALAAAVLVVWAVLAALFGASGEPVSGDECQPVQNGPYATVCE